MAQTPVNTPDGGTILVNHPEGASEEDILAFAQQQFISNPTASAEPTQEEPEPEVNQFFGPGAQAAVGLGLAEALGSVAKSALVDLPLAGLRGLRPFLEQGSLVDDGDRLNRSVEAIEETANKLQFEPRTRLGQRFLGEIQRDFLEPIDRAITEDVTKFGPFDVPPAVSAAGKTAILGAPAVRGLARNITGKTVTPPTSRQQLASELSERGIKIPEGDIEPGRTSRATKLLEDISEPAKTRAKASFVNSPIYIAQANKALNSRLGRRSPIDPVKIEDLQAYRSTRQGPYEALKNEGTIATDQVYFDALDATASELRGANPALRKANTPISEAIKMAKDLKQSQFDASTIAPTTQSLRTLADSAFADNAAGGAQVGRAYNQMRVAYEEAALRHLDRFSPNRGIVDNFRQARQDIATSYVVQESVGAGEIPNPAVLKRIRANKDAPPLHPELNLLAEGNAAFPGAVKLNTKPPQDISMIDLVVSSSMISGGLAGAAAGSPLAGLPVAAIGLANIAKPLTRAGLLSRSGQSAVRNPADIISRPGLTGGLISSGILSQGQEGLLEPPSVFNQ
jgi:hypothetical protein